MNVIAICRELILLKRVIMKKNEKNNAQNPGKREKKVLNAQGKADQKDSEYRLILSKLTERIKELNCLYGISRLVETTSSEDEILRGAISLIPGSWQYPAITHARIRLEDREYASEGFAESKWKQSEIIHVDGEACGEIEVFYSEKRPERDEGPFLLEERHLIHAIAERLGHIVARVEAGSRLESLYASEKNLRQALQEEMHNRVEFTRRLIHELKTPITSLLATSQLLSEELTDQKLSKLSKYVYENANRMNNRIDELHDVIKGEIGSPEVELRPVSLTEILNSTLGEVRSLAEQSQMKLTLIIEGENLRVLADASRLRQILLNLLNNAFKYTSGNGTVEIRTHTGSDEVTIQVQDNGPGIPKEEQERIFEPYYRSPHKARNSHGLGIGLALCKVLVAAHGGDIWVRSEPGDGASFFFTLKKAL